MTSYAAQAIKYLQTSRDVFDRALSDPAFIGQVAGATEIAAEALRSGKKILFAGNGGSAADAQHLAAELVVRFVVNRAALPAIALTTDSSILTAIGNDFGFEQLFARQIAALGNAGDVLVAISTSGRSANILAGCREARERKLSVIGLTGASGGSMSELCDVLVRVPSEQTAFIQQVHIAVGHIICAVAEDEISTRPHGEQ